MKQNHCSADLLSACTILKENCYRCNVTPWLVTHLLVTCMNRGKTLNRSSYFCNEGYLDQGYTALERVKDLPKSKRHFILEHHSQQDTNV